MPRPTTNTRRNRFLPPLLCLVLCAPACSRVALRPASPAEADLAYQRGTVALESGRYSEAIPELRTVLRARPEDVVARYNMGVALQRVRSFRESVQVLTGWGERGLDFRQVDRRIRVPFDADADYMYALGNSYQELREWDNALRCFEDAIETFPENLTSRYARAMLLQQRGKLTEARQAWIDYLQRDSSSAWAEGARKHLRSLEKELAPEPQ